VTRSRRTGQLCATVTATLFVAGTSCSSLDDVRHTCGFVFIVSVILFPVKALTFVNVPSFGREEVELAFQDYFHTVKDERNLQM